VEFSVRTTAVATLMLLVVCPPAQAQRPRPERPYRGLFGGNGANPNSSQQLDVSISLLGAYDDNVVASANQGYTGDPRFQASGSFGSGILSLDYTKNAGRLTFDFTGGTNYRYYQEYEEMTGFNEWLSLGMAAQLSPNSQLRLTGSASYSPFYSFSRAPGARLPAAGNVVPISPDYPLAEEPAISAYSSASFSHRLTPRSSLSADFNFNYTHYSDQDLPYQNWGAGGAITYRLSSRANMLASYHYRRGVSGLYYANEAIDTQDLQVGLDLTKGLSPSRTLTYGFSIGPSIYRSSVPVGAPEAAGRQKFTRYLVTCGAYLKTQIARSWVVGANYSRGMQYTQGFTDPLFSDRVTGTVTGFLADRVNLSFSVGYDIGSVGVAGEGNRYDTVTVAVTGQYALTGWAALSATYGYYHYLFDQRVQLPAALARGQDRNSVSVGMILWLPLLR
jgi:hypothetical protein